nr:MAG TPA: hypothetical protein [Caudoviricetes sp.]
MFAEVFAVQSGDGSEIKIAPISCLPLMPTAPLF